MPVEIGHSHDGHQQTRASVPPGNMLVGIVLIMAKYAACQCTAAASASAGVSQTLAKATIDTRRNNRCNIKTTTAEAPLRLFALTNHRYPQLHSTRNTANRSKAEIHQHARGGG